MIASWSAVEAWASIALVRISRHAALVALLSHDRRPRLPIDASGRVKVAQCKWLSWVGDDIGCRQPKMKHRISAAATEGANGMRFLSPTCWTSAHPNLAATTCTAAKTASRTAKGNAQAKPTHRKPTVIS